MVKKEKKSDDLMDTDEEEFDDSNDKKPAAAEAGDKKSRKRVIDDDDSDSDAAPEEFEEDESEEEEEEYANDDEEEEEENEDEEEEEVQPADSPTIQRVAKASKAKPETTKSSSSSSSTSPPKAKKQKTITGKKAPPPATKGSKKSSVSASQMKSNTKLQNIMSSALDTHDTSQKLWKVGNSTLYSALCDTFSDVEEISSRLDIQEKLTELFRKVLLMDGGGDRDDDDEDMKDMDEKKKESSKPSAAASSKKGGKKAEEDTRSDLYTLLYLCSNQVAPQHANVELGVGDSILIKAIGEASGTAPNMIKKKYEKEGDLGSVAMTAKGKQRTLVGFGRMSGPKRLSCKDVLMVFKEIVSSLCDFVCTFMSFA